MAPAQYGISARTTTDELIRCDTVADLADLPALLAEYATQFADRTDVHIDLDTTTVTRPRKDTV